MKLTLTALFDDATRAQVREAVLGEARGVARSVIDGEIEAEIKRTVNKHLDGNWGGATRKFEEVLNRLLGVMLKNSWDDLAKMIQTAAERAAQLALSQKARMLDDAGVRALVRDEVRKMLTGTV